MTKNDEPFEPVPEIEYKVNPTGIAEVSSTGLITALTIGKCTITGKYKAKPNDISTSNKVTVEVKEDTPKRIYVDPPYDENGYTAVRHTWGAFDFTCKAEGIPTPKWNITLDPNGAKKWVNDRPGGSGDYISTIDNANGKFSCECKHNNGILMTYHIEEKSSGLAIDYIVKLASAF